MIELIIFYILGALITSNLVVIWKMTMLPVHLLNLYFRFRKREEIYTYDEFEEYVLSEWGIFGEWITCPLCFASSGVSTVVSTIITCVNGFSWLFIPVCIFSWPLIMYVIYTHLKKN